jgi:hypothetical protein
MDEWPGAEVIYAPQDDSLHKHTSRIDAHEL